MFTKLFWKDTAERVVSTMAQVLVTLLAVEGFDLLTVDFKAFLAAVVTAGLLTLAKAVAAAKFTGPSVSPASFAADDRGVVRR